MNGSEVQRDNKKGCHSASEGTQSIPRQWIRKSYQMFGPLSAKAWTRKSMKARTFGWVKRPGG